MVTDEKELLARTAQGDEIAFTQLLERYAPLIRAAVSHFAPSFVTVEGTPRLSDENLEQEARLALYRAACSYDENRVNVTFGLYAKICIRNALISELRRVHPRKRETTKPKEELPAAAKLFTETDGRTEALLRQTEALLSRYEISVFRLYLQGLPPRDIAKRLGKGEKSIYNALCRIRSKTGGAKSGSKP